VLHTKGQGGEISFFFHHHWIVAHSEEKGSTRDAEVNLEAGDGLGEEKWTRRRCGLGSEKHTWRTRERCALEEGEFGGYDCEKRTRRIRRSSGLDRHGGYGWRSEHRLVKPGRYSWSGGYGVEAAAEDHEHRLVKPGRLYERGEHEIGSTVSLNRDEMAGAEDTGWMPQWRIVSTVSLNRAEGMSAEDTTWDDQHRL